MCCWLVHVFCIWHRLNFPCIVWSTKHKEHFLKMHHITVRLLSADQLIQSAVKDFLYPSSEKIITFNTLWLNSADNKLIFFLILLKQIGSNISCKFGDNLHVKAYFLGNKKKLFCNVICWNFYPACWALSRAMINPCPAEAGYTQSLQTV